MGEWREVECHLRLMFKGHIKEFLHIHVLQFENLHEQICLNIQHLRSTLFHYMRKRVQKAGGGEKKHSTRLVSGVTVWD